MTTNRFTSQTQRDTRTECTYNDWAQAVADERARVARVLRPSTCTRPTVAPRGLFARLFNI